jgi:hypothetical protein
MIGLLESRHFGLVMLDFDLETEGPNYYTEYYMTAPIRAAIQANYQLPSALEMPGPEKLREEAKFYIWVPRSQAASGGLAPGETK